ncbi:hypothetical protein D3C86_1965650 [compost metagenome]
MVDCQSSGCSGTQGSQQASVCQQEWRTGFHGHQHGPGSYEWFAVGLDVRRRFNAVHLFFTHDPQVIDEISLSIGELHQLLWRLHGVAGTQSFK